MEFDVARRRRCGDPRASNRRRGPSRAPRRRWSTVRNAARSSENSWLRAPRRRSITPRQPVSSHTRSKASAGPTRHAATTVGASPRSSASSTIALSAKRAPDRKRRSSCPLSCRSSNPPPERRDHLLAHSSRLAPALDDLQISATTRGLLAEIHGRLPDANSIAVRTDIRFGFHLKIMDNRRNTWHSILSPRPSGSIHINNLQATSMLQLSKISLTGYGGRGVRRAPLSRSSPSAFAPSAIPPVAAKT